MKIVITSKGTATESEVDQRFGRARYLIVIDTDTSEVTSHDNEVNLNAAQGAGIQTAQNVANLGVNAVITGHVGPNAFRTLSAAKIDVYTGASGTVQETLFKFQGGEMSPVQSADVEGHWII